VWYLNGGFEVLAPQIVLSDVTGVSDNGQVSATVVGLFHGNSEGVVWSWKPTLHVERVPSFSDANCCYPFSTANAINSAGHVVGDSSLSQAIDSFGDFIEGDHAYLWANGVLTDIGVLGNPTPSDSLGTSVAYGLNNRDDVVGQSEANLPSPDPSCPGCAALHAFLWHRGKLTDLGNLAHIPQWSSKANAINDAGEIVGSAEANVAGNPTTRAFVHIHGTMFNLTFMVHHRDLNVRLVNAVGINCHGWIAANGYDITEPTVNRAYLLIPKGAPVREGCPRPRWN
jgi:probable HAF family extracellular repeat protein